MYNINCSSLRFASFGLQFPLQERLLYTQKLGLLDLCLLLLFLLSVVFGESFLFADDLLVLIALMARLRNGLYHAGMLVAAATSSATGLSVMLSHCAFLGFRSK